MSGPRIGSLFSGAGGLDMAVEAVFGGQVVWHSEIDKAASKVLAHRWPDVPNLGDITAIDWADIPPIDVLCGGFPCQDVSAAGKRAGIKDGTRSGLWSVMADAIDYLRPRMVVIENVRGLLNAAAHRNMEPADPAMGDGAGRPVLRAAGAVLGDLADLGYDAAWTTLAASDVGACHRRERVFILATDTQHAGSRREANYARERCGTPRESRPDSGIELLPTPRATDPANASSHSSPGFRPQLGEVVRELLPTPTAVQGRNETSGRSNPDSQHHNGTTLHDVVFKGEIGDLLPTPNASDCSGGGMHPDSRYNADGMRHSRQLIDDVKLEPERFWGKYEAAIRRWEALTRPAPAPTEPNKNGNPRLAAAFSEWMMGWPTGHVTQVPGISRNDALRIIGNGVVPQCAAAALRWLLSVCEVAA